MYFIYNRKRDVLLNIGTKGFAGYKTRKTAESYLASKLDHTIGYVDRTIMPCKWVVEPRTDYEIIEVEIK